VSERTAILIRCVAILAALAVLLPGCGGTPKKPRRPDRVIIKDTPAPLRDAVLAQATLRGTEPLLVSGYGLVVDLAGTGGGDCPGPIRAAMEREMLIMGVGKEIGPFKDLSPNDILNDPRVAVVIVSAAVPPGAPAGTKFDVRIDAIPGTATTSLEGGRLYTTRLFRGMVRPSMPATEPIAQAKGELFINPFADPASAGKDSVYRTVGRVLNGGTITQPLAVTLTLDAPSHARAKAIADAINGRFPRGRGEEQVARGLNEETIQIFVPGRYRDDAGQFFNLLQHVRVDRMFPEEAAKQYVEALRAQPDLANNIAWCLEALGPVAIPHVRSMYQFPELNPRMAALTAGAKLGDLTTRPRLEEVVTSGPPALRTGAIDLLGNLPTDPKVNEFLRDQLHSPELDVRIAAYTSLERRGDPFIERRRVDGKFTLDTVPSAEPMVYATIQNEPRVVVFGDDVPIRRPVFASVWEDRLMVSALSPNDPVKVFYKDYRTGRAVQGDGPALLVDLIEYLGHKTTPESPAPGLNLSYSEVVGSLSAMLSKGLAAAPFVPESDKLELDLIRVRQTDSGTDRPEVEDQAPAEPVPAEPDRPEAPATEQRAPTASPPEPAKKKYVVPLPPK
jgi:hypothetical protein